jgi:hypothetical protein
MRIIGYVTIAAALLAGAISLLSKKAYGKGHYDLFSVGVNRRTKPVKGIVIHWTNTETPNETVRILKARKLATAFEVDQQGRTYQYINPATHYTDSTGNGSNDSTIAIDLTHVPGEPWSTEQVKGTIDLIKSLADSFNIPIKVAPDGQVKSWASWDALGYTVFRHRNFKPTDCPGDFPLEILNELQ